MTQKICHKCCERFKGDGIHCVKCAAVKKSADEKVELLDMLKRFAAHGEQLWDDENFRNGYKKVSSGDLVDCRNLLRQFGVTEFNE